jgi:hypothetical protein
MTYRRKLTEVTLPLEAINNESARKEAILIDRVYFADQGVKYVCYR